MSSGKSKIGRILLRTACVLLGLGVVAAGTISYAKYISGEEEKQSSIVANMGVELFELVEFGSATAQEKVEIDYSKVVPGADIPGPHIRLQIESEVSWSLFVKVTQSNNLPIRDRDGHDIVAYYIDLEHWTQVGEPTVKRDSTEYTYQYNDVFRPIKRYDFTGANEIAILSGGGGEDVIYVSQYYDRMTKFSLSFETYIRQVLK